MPTAKYWIKKLKLEAHPEGGHYREVYRNPSTIQVMEGGGKRNLATSIYFLLAGKEQSHFHQLESDELWYYHAGGSTRIHIFENELYRSEVLGTDLEAGHSLQVLLPRKSIFAAEVMDKESYTLMGCMVNPGFDFKDFRLVPQAELLAIYPDHQELILDLALDEV